MNRTLYSLLLYIFSPLLVAYLVFRSVKSPSYRSRWGERFGLKALKQTDLLVHSVSMGETLAAIPLIKRMQAQYPNLTITVTTSSPTGSEEVTKAFGNSVQHCYLPFDLPWCVKRFIRQLAPKTCVIMETELWPNLVHYLSLSGVKIMLANARLSAKSAQQYHQRPSLSLPMLKQLTAIAAQSEQAAERFIDLGVDKRVVEVCGSLKFDIRIDDSRVHMARELRQTWRTDDAPIWVAGSVHPGELDAMLSAHQQLLAIKPNALLILVPRHPEKFDAAANAIKASGLNLVRRSEGDAVTADTQVLLGDTMGELLTFYGAADQAFVGGTLIENGGHNPLEPAAFGLPTFVGPHHWDFAEITALLRGAGALQVIDSADALAKVLIDNMTHAEQYQQASEAANRVVMQNKGALDKQYHMVSQLLN